MTGQLSFDLPPQVRLGAGDFFVSDTNRAAFNLVTGAGPWPEGKLLVFGPAGAGKSHLVRVWQGLAGAVRIAARDLAPGPAPEGEAFAVEDLQDLPAAAEETLFHLHNRLARSGGRLLLTADRPAPRWRVALPDLRSRMEATTAVRIDDPDDRLMTALLAKLFADRQLVPAPQVIPWLVARIERSHAAAARIVDRLDTAALAEGRGLTLGLARTVLGGLETGPR